MAIYGEDTDDTKQAQYVQVTFTMGNEYAVPEDFPLIPLESVWVGKGVIADSATMEHACETWTELTKDSTETVMSEFETWMEQDCAPTSSMCSSPSSAPDGFVSFHIPLGIGTPENLVTTLVDYMGAGANDLSEIIFVQMTIVAMDPTQGIFHFDSRRRSRSLLAAASSSATASPPRLI